VTGIAVEAGSQVVRFTGFVDTKVGEDVERRIVARRTITRLAAFELCGSLLNAGVRIGPEQFVQIAAEMANGLRDKALDY
jgi:hypothetical protein